ncbi:MAG TPA: sialate O-acetylesterase, partial [Balneolaceae bacterium]|nr:sialate O-acetylesterase [Balneolaceae bacterium]
VQSYKKRNFDDSNWDEMQLPTDWEKAGYPNLDGIMWFRKTVQIPASWKGKTLTLSLGPIDDNDVTWFNGHKVGSTKGWTIKRSYTVPGRFVKTGENVIAVRVLDTGGNGGIYGKTKLLKLYPAHASTSDTIGLAGKWKYKIGAKKPHAQLISNPNTPTVLYNGMIAPLIPFHIRGVIWYQGESNVGRARQYSRLFPDMIKDWRNHWKEGKFPFYYVQIAPFPYGSNGKQGAALRDAQRRSLRVPNTGMVVTMDIGDTTLIHPANKEEVGRRLSLWAMAHVYGKQGLVDSGPLYKSMKVKGPEAVISFTHVDGGLVAKNGNLKEFEIAGSNGRFVPAQATIQGNKVVVHASDVHHPTAVRYGWKDTAQAYLFNKAGLPASSFTTENLTGQK